MLPFSIISTCSRAVTLILAPIMALCVSSCVTPTSVSRAPSVPAAFDHVPVVAGAPPRTGAWVRAFGSDELGSLIDEATLSNTDIAAATARVAQAAARAHAAHAALLPSVDAAASANRFSGRASNTSANETDWSVLLSASYEVDFWGKNHAAMRAAGARAMASAADRDTVALTTQAAVATTYFQILSLRERQRLAQSNINAAREILKVIDARQGVGAASAVELAIQRAAVAAAELTIPDLQQQELAARGALAVLTGHDPEGFDVAGQSLESLVLMPVDPGIPAALLTRRPDLAAAEASLAAADADVTAARAAMLPSFSLTGTGGLQNPAVQAAVDTLAGTGPTLVLGAALTQAIFDGGKRRAVRDESLAHADELLAIYRGAIRNALLDVETALSANEHFAQQENSYDQTVQQSERAVDAAQLRYRAGSGDYLTLLEAQKSSYAIREAQAQYRLARLQTLVNLSKALGGDWKPSRP